MMRKIVPQKALITGINGQDGSYLAELLIDEGYEVHGLVRRTSEPLMDKIAHLQSQIIIHYGDMSDAGSLNRIIKDVQPNEIYNLAAMSQVRWSYDNPAVTFDINTLGLLRIIEAVRDNGLAYGTKIYQACSSEMFGRVQETPQTEKTPFYPQSPYGVSKTAAYYMAKTYREAYKMDIRCGILFNHESPRRGIEFLSRKVCRAVAEIAVGQRDVLEVGNMYAKRDWGYAAEYVRWIYAIMQHSEPDDFVIGTGETHTVKEWIEEAFRVVEMNVEWAGFGVNEIGYVDGVARVKVNPDFYRPAEVDLLLADASKSRKILGFTPKITFKHLVDIMTNAELRQLQ